MPRQTILACNLSDARLSKLRFLCMKLGVLVKAVPAEDFAQPVGALCGVLERTEAADDDSFTDEMIVFCHMDHPFCFQDSTNGGECPCRKFPCVRTGLGI